MAAKKSYDVISPDGFSIHFSAIYKTRKEALKAFRKWRDGYLRQGYYSSVRGRIPLDELLDHCRIIEINQENQSRTVGITT